MRRFLLWHLPLSASLVAVAIFGYGFLQFLRGETGTPVNLAVAEAPAPAARAVVAPIILGDSLARGAGDEQGLGIGGRLDAELRVRRITARRTFNVGVNGAKTPDLMRLLERPNVRALLAESNVIVVSIGGNDLWGGTDWRSARPPDPDAVMGDVLGRIEKIVEGIRKTNPTARIFFVGLYNPFAASPAGVPLDALVHRWNARLVDHFAGDRNFTLVPTSDLFSHRDRLALDRFHPAGEGYALIARRIAESL